MDPSAFVNSIRNEGGPAMIRLNHFESIVMQKWGKKGGADKVSVPSDLSFQDALMRLKNNDPSLMRITFEPTCAQELYAWFDEVLEALESNSYVQCVLFPVLKDLWEQLSEPVAVRLIEYIGTSKSLKHFGVWALPSNEIERCSSFAKMLVMAACKNKGVTSVMAAGVTFNDTEPPLCKLSYCVSRLLLCWCGRQETCNTLLAPDNDEQRSIILRELYCLGLHIDDMLLYLRTPAASSLEALQIWQFQISPQMVASVASFLENTKKLTCFGFVVGHTDGSIEMGSGQKPASMEQLIPLFKSLANNTTLDSLDLTLPEDSLTAIGNQAETPSLANTVQSLTRLHIESNPNLVDLELTNLTLDHEVYRAKVKGNKLFLEALESDSIPPGILPWAIKRGLKSRNGRDSVFHILQAIPFLSTKANGEDHIDCTANPKGM